MRGGSRTYLPVQRQHVGGRPPTVAARLDSEPAVAASSFPEVEHQLRAGSPLAAPGLAGLQALQRTSGNQAVQRLISEPASPVAVQRVRGGAAPPSLTDRARAGATSLGARMIGAVTGDRAGAEKTAAGLTGQVTEENLPLGVSDLVQNSAGFGTLAEELNAQNTMARTAQGMAQDHAVSSTVGHAIDATVGGAFGSTVVSTGMSAGRNLRQAAALGSARGDNADVNAALNLGASRQRVEAGLNVAAGAGSAAMTATGLGIASGATSVIPTIGMAIHDRARRDEINAVSERAAEHLSSPSAADSGASSRAVGALLRDQRAGAASEGASVLAGTQLFRRGITGGGNALMAQASAAQGLERQVAEQAAAARATDESAELALHAPPMAMPLAQPRAPVAPVRTPVAPSVSVVSAPVSAPAMPRAVPRAPAMPQAPAMPAQQAPAPVAPAINLDFAGVSSVSPEEQARQQAHAADSQLLADLGIHI